MRQQKQPNAKAKKTSSRAERPVAKGASQSKTLVSDRFGAYLAHHRFSASDSLMRLLRIPGQSLLTWMVIAVALALPATMFTSLQNLQAVGQRWDGVSQLSVFINPRAKAVVIDKLRQQLASDPRVDSVS